MSADTILSALLDYYSDKASAEASAVVATTFGLFIVLTASGYRPWAFLVYWILWGAGLYFLMGFGYWALHTVWTINMIVGRTPSRTNARVRIDKQIENRVRNHWKKTFLRCIFIWFKYREKPRFRQVFRETEKEDVIRLSDLLHIFFFGFGVMLSFIFFREETRSLCGVMFVSALLFLFFLDGFSIVRHRRLR